jgi:hypothetical protein
MKQLGDLDGGKLQSRTAGNRLGRRVCPVFPLKRLWLRVARSIETRSS